MEKTTKKNGLPIIAGVLLLVVFLMKVTGAGRFPLLSMALSLLLIAAAFLDRKDDLAPIALGLSLLTSLRGALMAFMLAHFTAALHIIPTLLLFLLALPQTRQKLRKVWFLPALILGILTFAESFNGGGGLLAFLIPVLNVYADIMLGLWLRGSEVSAKNLFCLNLNDVECSDDEILLHVGMNLVVKAIFLMLAVVVLLGVAGVLEGNEALIPSIMLFIPFVLLPVLFIFKLGIATREDRKRMKHGHNVMMASLGHDEGLRKEQAKAARNKVIKSALIGGVIAGDTGAVIGAVAEKAKQDAESGGSGAADPKAVTKGAVIGGIVAGEAGAIVGAAAAKAGENAKQKKK